ncbi:Cytosine deaminase [Mycena kentingensis (nom. inval.)]|nr:Cytosine deaminase [Mycena kentingensis (nom. inval.)]
MLPGVSAAYDEAAKGYAEGGIPIGSVLIASDGTILGRGHNQRIQKSSATLHAEIAALEHAGRLKASVYREATLVRSLSRTCSPNPPLFYSRYGSPCSMCTGAILLYKIPRVVVGENVNFMGEEELLRANGVQVTVVDDAACKELMAKFIRDKPEEWNEDIGE